MSIQNEYLNGLMERVVQRDPGEKEFHQAVLDAYQQTLSQIPQRQQEGQSQEAPPAPEMKM